MTAIEWSDGAPIYRQLKERVVAMLLDGLLKPGDALPSVRQVAAEYQRNPLTVSRAYQELADEAIVEKRRGLGMYVTEGASEKLLNSERERFLREEWPLVLERIQRLIGPNGAGKTTALKAMLGLIPFEGEMRVLGRDPRTQRDELMNDVCFIADVAVLPRWIRVREAIEFVAGVHPRFDRMRCERFLANTQLKPDMRVRELSKGMIVQLHLALVMFIRDGKIVLEAPMDAVGERYIEVLVNADRAEEARNLRPIDERALPFGKTVMLFDGVEPGRLTHLGETRTPGLADLFVATMKGTYA